MRSRSKGGGNAFVALVAALGLLLVPAQCRAVSFGANLSRAPNNTTTCNSSVWTYPYANPFTNCSFDFQDVATGETVFPPAGNGVVTKVRVRVGPTTGPMQVVVEQALRKDNPGDPGHPTYACCQAINASQVFTPNANAITEIPVNLPVRQDLAPDPSTGIYTDQHLALSVLAPNVPIPANLDSNGFYGGWFPARHVGDERAGPYGGQGAVILLNADWSAGSAAKACKKAKKGAQSAKKKRCKKKKRK
jgi:hypothetical protein